MMLFVRVNIVNLSSCLYTSSRYIIVNKHRVAPCVKVYFCDISYGFSFTTRYYYYFVSSIQVRIQAACFRKYLKYVF